MKAYELAALPPKILFYSRPGLGKTALAMTLGEDCLYVDLDDNLEVAFGLNDAFKSDRLAVEVQQFLDEKPDKSDSFDRCSAFISKVSNQCQRGEFSYKYFVLDSLTSLQVACMNGVLFKEGKLGKNPEIQHWGKRDTQLFRLVSILRTLPIPVFILAHEMVEDVGGTMTVKIAMDGQKLPPKIVRMFNEIWYLRARPGAKSSTDLFIQTVPTATITCRSGRGLKTGTRYATILKDGSPENSVGMRELLDSIVREEGPPSHAIGC